MKGSNNMNTKVTINFNEKYTTEEYAVIYEIVGEIMDLYKYTPIWNGFSEKMKWNIIEYTDRFNDDEFKEWYKEKSKDITKEKLIKENIIEI